MRTWPKTGENKQLDRYWRRTGGTLYTEVCLGEKHWGSNGWGGAAAERRFDGVRVGDGDPLGPFGHGRFHEDAQEALRGRAVELIEVKRGLGEAFLGQALVGRWMFQQQVGLEVTRTVVLHRHQDPAMCWVAQKLDLAPIRDEPAPAKNVPTQSRAHYALHDAALARLATYRASAGGLWLTRVPLGGPDCGVREWETASQTWIPFVRVHGERSDDIHLYEDRHRDLLLDRERRLELVLPTARKRFGRGPLGVLASHALMFERQYGRPFDSCTIVCGVTDPAMKAAYVAIGGTRGLPPVSVFATAEPS